MSVRNRWLDALDVVDPFFGDPVALHALLATAPTLEDAAWLEGQIAANKRFSDTVLTTEATQ